MFLGVPYTPFFIAAGVSLALAAYVNILLIVLLPISVFILRQIAKQDDMIFRLWGLKVRYATRARNKELYQDMQVFSPNQYREKPPKD